MPIYPWIAHYEKGIPAEIDPDFCPSIPALLDDVARRFGDHTAFVSMDQKLSFRQVSDCASDLAGYLQSARGLKPGDRVAIMMPNILQYPVSLFGVLKAGFIAVNVNPLYTARELHNQLLDCGASAVIIAENFGRTLEKALPGTGVRLVISTGIADLFGFMKRTVVNFALRHVKKMIPEFSIEGLVPFRSALAEGRSRGFRPVAVKNTDVALLQYTGGTTGISKGAMLTHRNVLANVEQTGRWISQTFQIGKERALTALPLYHIFSFTATLCFLKRASAQLLIANPRDINNVIDAFEKWKPTAFPGVNSLFNALLNSERFRGLDFSQLKMTVGGGAQVQRPVAEKWKKVTGHTILEAYGLTEASPGICGNLPDSPWDGSVGFPLPSTVISIRNDRFEDLGVCADPAQIEAHTGEICAKGPQVMKGYWNQPEETARVLQDGWLHTGDIGWMDKDGRVTITDRKKDLIIVSGYNVYPNEVESVIAANPKVLEVGVVGEKSKTSDETIKAVIVKKDPSLTVQEIRSWCRERLTGYKRPRKIVFVESLPKSPVGKILRRELRSL
ncbi:MAG: AMP-binding protein [Mesosutterella sp.]|nr:AMP-binding protein [Mesosutterella sp.]